MDASRRCHGPFPRAARHHPLLCISMFPADVISTNHEFDIAAVHDHLSLLRFLEAGDDGHGLLLAFLRVRFMWKNAHAQAGRLLRILQLWNSRLSTHPARKRAPRVVECGRPSQVQRPRCGSLRCRFAITAFVENPSDATSMQMTVMRVGEMRMRVVRQLVIVPLGVHIPSRFAWRSRAYRCRPLPRGCE